MTEYLRTPHVILEDAVKENTFVLGTYRDIGHRVSQQALGRVKAATYERVRVEENRHLVMVLHWVRNFAMGHIQTLAFVHKQQPCHANS